MSRQIGVNRELDVRTVETEVLAQSGNDRGVVVRLRDDRLRRDEGLGEHGRDLHIVAIESEFRRMPVGRSRRRRRDVIVRSSMLVIQDYKQRFGPRVRGLQRFIDAGNQCFAARDAVRRMLVIGRGKSVVVARLDKRIVRQPPILGMPAKRDSRKRVMRPLRPPYPRNVRQILIGSAC